MNRYSGHRDLSGLSWLKVQPNFSMYGYDFRVEHRGIYIYDFLSYQDEKDFKKVIDFIVGLQKAINYYLDAIWC